MVSRLYVGINKSGHWKVFRSKEEPTHSSHGHIYGAVIGPFRTKAGAEFMAKYGKGNPHLQTVADAERIAKYYKEGRYGTS